MYLHIISSIPPPPLSKMIVCRTFTLLFLMCVTACGVCSSLFPLFRRSYDVNILTPPQPVSSTYNRREVIYYWYAENTTGGSYPSLNYSRSYNSARKCDTTRTYFVASAALSTAGAGLAGIATIMSAAWIYAGFDSCLHSFIVFVTFLAFACYLVTLALVCYLYLNDTCSNGVNHAVAFKNASPQFHLVEGFILMCIATGGLLIVLVLEALSFCLCTSTDDYCGGHDRGGNDAAVPAVSTIDSTHSVVMRDGSVVTVSKPMSLSRSNSSASIGRSRGETSMSRRASSESLSRTSSSSSIGSDNSSRSSRSMGSRSSTHSSHRGHYRSRH